MVAKADTQSDSSDKLKLYLAAAISIAGLVGFYVLSDQSLLFRIIGLLVVFGVAMFIAYQTVRGKQTVEFFKDARTEVRKVVWPTRAETVQTTITVFIIVFLIGVFLWLLDMLLSSLFQMITGI
ncbi:MAG: preprotein translocase subunit SecE [Gammaproteobacteria bacterium]|nr:preprotein translocase subunit SecE [Gammaproteobacteria bacterium]